MFGRTNASDRYLHLPSRAGRAAMEEFERRNESKIRLNWGIPLLDDYLVPMMPGDLISIMARPGMCKTTSMIHLARQANTQLQQVDPGGDNYVVYVTWETLVEEFVAIKNAHLSGVTLESIGRGQADLSDLATSIAGSITERIAVIGLSMANADGKTKGDLRMPTLQDVDDILTEMRDQGMTPALVMYDYLQRIPGQPGKDRSAQVSENLETLKDMAMRHRAPSVVGVQAKRDVDEYSGVRMPQMSDGQWTSNIEQTSDKVFGLTRPSLYWTGKTKDGDEAGISTEDGAYEVTDSLLCLKPIKQRWGPSGRLFCLELDPALGTLTEARTLEEAY